MIIFCTIWSILFVSLIYWLYHKSPTDLKVKDLKIPKRKFVLLVLQWCDKNLGSVKSNYQLKIYYYPNKTFLGQYFSGNRQIVIWVHDDLNLLDLTSTIIHEWRHFTQFTKSANQKDYDKRLTEVGYWNNPYEIDARAFEKRFRKECFYHVLKQISGD